MGKKKILIAIIAIAIIVIILFSIVFLVNHGVEGKWHLETYETLNADASVNQTHPVNDDIWWEFRSDGQVFYSNNSGISEHELIANVTWEYTGDDEISVSTFIIYPTSNYTDVMTFGYERDFDSLTLIYYNPANEVHQQLTFRKA